jgi:GxxExxY protein
MRVHSRLGPGLLESAYEACLCRALALEGLAFEKQRGVPVQYEGLRLDCGFRLDLLVEGEVLVEVKAIADILPIHIAQLRTYLKLSGHECGLLINFNTLHLRNGIRQLSSSRRPSPSFPVPSPPFR